MTLAPATGSLLVMVGTVGGEGRRGYRTVFSTQQSATYWRMDVPFASHTTRGTNRRNVLALTKNIVYSATVTTILRLARTKQMRL
jgi:hypothetical protein